MKLNTLHFMHVSTIRCIVSYHPILLCGFYPICLPFSLWNQSIFIKFTFYTSFSSEKWAPVSIDVQSFSFHFIFHFNIGNRKSSFNAQSYIYHFLCVSTLNMNYYSFIFLSFSHNIITQIETKMNEKVHRTIGAMIISIASK